MQIDEYLREHPNEYLTACEARLNELARTCAATADAGAREDYLHKMAYLDEEILWERAVIDSLLQAFSDAATNTHAS